MNVLPKKILLVFAFPVTVLLWCFEWSLIWIDSQKCSESKAQESLVEDDEEDCVLFKLDEDFPHNE